jgi:hypothetical protein
MIWLSFGIASNRKAEHQCFAPALKQTLPTTPHFELKQLDRFCGSSRLFCSNLHGRLLTEPIV